MARISEGRARTADVAGRSLASTPGRQRRITEMRSVVVAVVFALAATHAADAAPARTITGSVVDDAGVPVEGAIVVGVDESATTAADGTFTLTVAADETELVVTAPGYATRVLKLARSDDPADRARAGFRCRGDRCRASARATGREDLQADVVGSAAPARAPATTRCAPRRRCPASRAFRTRSAASCCAARRRATTRSTSTGSRCRSRFTSAASPRSIRAGCSSG